MKLSSISLLVSLLVLPHSHVSAAALPEHLEPRQFTVGQGVQTSSGLVVGHAASNRTHVSEYLGIPYAKPPIGNLRFANPQPYTSRSTFNAASYSPDCPAYTASSDGVPPGLAGLNSLRLLQELAEAGDTFSEDCLTLNIWTKPQTGDKAKAVLFWIYGGGFQIGNTNNPDYDGEYFAANEDVIVVTANYRLNIFGFPGLPGFSQNPGLLDQRLAIEWVRDNIAGFGGDPSRITIFGQSAGGVSVDYYSYAYTQDPIVAGFIPESGTVANFGTHQATNNTAAWYNATEALSCGGPSVGIPATIACMRTKSFQAILNATIPAPGLTSVLGNFDPTIDNQVVFSDYPARAAAGNFIQRPFFTGNNDYEAGLFKIVAAEAGTTLSDAYWDLFDLVAFTCPAASAAATRAAHGVPTWRYRYFGDFPNLRLTLNPDSGAWHGAEIPVVWETAPQASGEADTSAEASISRYMHGAWAAFAKAPATGLSQFPYLWPEYKPLGDTLIRLAYNNQTRASYAFPATYDAECAALGAGAAL